ncbi:MAG TPA: Druantia anti-phage system protein DruA [Syntrophobacteraceae bacterium]|nr:Druantia anti-phage system protein DruA [Syntrophobacteraceae bacterium]
MSGTYRIRSRRIDHNELKIIRDSIAQNWAEGRSAISRILCRHWNWRQENGLLKDMACRALLLSLEKKGEIKLPPRQNENFRFPRKAPSNIDSYDTSEIRGRVSDFGSLTIRMVRFSPEEALWDHLVDKFHYLAHPWIVGSYLKYIACLGDRPVACLGWGSAAWKVACRDRIIGWSAAVRQRNLNKVIDNVRFLILPWVHIEHLASKVLAANIRALKRDWLHFYREPALLLETFVDKEKFSGTCYRAANWVCVGLTKGRGKYDRHTRYLSSVKAVFLYPLAKNFREVLND